ncbi:Asp23/Gls24 family envelope stress response protein [Ligilactobacillus ceti]|uniref:Alkaline shock protein n=1 Tax=Ligilactobacillus ceti DSM 22408 TaxID=1122146 RepID=A0A0R2KHB6_9LACO|nr:Asp23/Gls24 family envelope stress response protein [Ligilactobacillus ceti]KRN88667.1 alkaline shock protein [Ligilactobacillus ceti DSM 22408]
MAEDNNIVLTSQEPSLGEVRIAPEVIEIIIGIAASKVDGVYSMRGSLANSLSELFGRHSRGKGVKLEKDDSQLSVDVYAFLDYGVAVPKVAVSIQEKVRQQVLFMTGLELAEVNVHVEGVVPEQEKEEQVVDPDNLFDENNGDEA